MLFARLSAEELEKQLGVSTSPQLYPQILKIRAISIGVGGGSRCRRESFGSFYGKPVAAPSLSRKKGHFCVPGAVSSAQSPLRTIASE